MASKRGDQDYHGVFTTKTVVVHPKARPPLTSSSSSSSSTLLHLSNLDTKCPALMYLVFFYRPTQPPASSSLFSSLKRGLEEALSSWYPAAGRLCFSPPSGKLTVACTGAGALLVEASTAVKISDLGDLSQPNDFLDRLVFKPPVHAPLEETPLVVAQVTRFACGGFAIGVGTNHALFDGVANYNFLNAWASRAVGGGKQICAHHEPVLHERGRLQLAALDQHDHGGDFNDQEFMALGHLHQLIKQAAAVREEERSHEDQIKMVLRTFSVGCGMVSRLKIKAASSCTSFEVVAAHLWKARTKALNIAGHKTVCLQFTVDARDRIRPPLPPSFAGNAFVLSSLLSTAADLDRLPFAALVLRIQAAKRAVTHAYVARYVAALGETAPRTSLPPLPELTMVSDWTKTPYHRVDFGAGEAAYVAPLATPMPQTAYFLQSPGEAGRVDVRIGLPEKSLRAFESYFLSGF
ncbi:brassinosteroid-related acyltransferase 1-like [Zingiber officinale]|uniref:brassinosteroid-related acyltransferase 1-like n=1 Tax=Zingiber officinale TaxID=94328 RepID=UPI001C4B74EF|nr:brassinosteroid-related acyltransferase 1-like [Zingiber officinale]